MPTASWETKNFSREDRRCPLCQAFVSHFTPGALSYQLLRRDADLCPYYSGANPQFYRVCVCPSCHYAAYPEDFELLEPRYQAPVSDALGRARKGMVDFGQPERSLFAALQSFQLAIACYRARHVAENVIASLRLQAAWVCRYSGELNRELGFLQAAIDEYGRALASGIREDPYLEDLPVAYLLGELQLRSGRTSDAVVFFQRALAGTSSNVTVVRMIKDRLAHAVQTAKVRDFLEARPLFALVGDQALSLLAVHAEPLPPFPPGASVCRQGQKGDSLLLVTEGRVSVFVDDPGLASPVRILREGDVFGEMSLLGGEPRSATVIAGEWTGARWIKDAELLSIGRAAFRNILKLEPTVVAKMAEVVAGYRSGDIARSVAHRQAEEARARQREQADEKARQLARIRTFLNLGDDGMPLEEAGGVNAHQ